MNKNKLPSPQEEYEEKLEQTTNMITAEDLVEQTVYAVNAPKCCSDSEQAKNMLNMLGANIIDNDIYHKPNEHTEVATETDKDKKINVKINDKEISLIPELVVYVVPDFMGDQQHNIGLNLYYEGENGLEPFSILTKNFGEFIGQKFCAYVDTNNCPFSDQLLEQGIAADTSMKKESGFCSYPLWKFNEEFLKGIDESLYWLYSGEYDEYIESMHSFDDNCETQEQKM